MPDHILSNEDGYMTSAVMDTNGEANHLRGDGAPSRPGLDDGLLASVVVEVHDEGPGVPVEGDVLSGVELVLPDELHVLHGTEL